MKLRALQSAGLGLLHLVVPGSLAHDLTLPRHEAALDPSEARRLAAAPSLRTAARATPPDAAACQLSVRLVDAETGRPLPGLLRASREDGTPLELPGLVNRGVKLRNNHPGKAWHAVVGPAVVDVPRAKLRIDALAGIEAEFTTHPIDLTGQSSAEVTLPVRRFSNLKKHGWRSGNTHLHLRGLTRAQADEYLETIPAADGLELLFVSYLERAEDDRDYISNEYRPASLQALAGHGTAFGWGQEHRHNFGPGGEGYGHVMLLDLQDLVQPVSIGEGITRRGPDFPPLRPGLETAHAQGAHVVWCHNTFGFEDVPNWLAGRVHAHNIFDGGAHGSYEDTFYRFLNIGLRVPFSTGTDWFMYDFSRVYVRLEGEPAPRAWLQALAAGRSFISNGPLLELRAGPHEIGDIVRVDRPRSVGITGRASGRTDFGRLELVHNGRIIHRTATQRHDGHHVAEMEFTLEITEPGWIALRVAGDSTVVPPNTPVRGTGAHRNEMGEALFGHTSPIYFDFAGRATFQSEAARSLVEELQSAIRTIEKQGKFETTDQKDQVLQAYWEAVARLEGRLRQP
jgi:hypothetical protein